MKKKHFFKVITTILLFAMTFNFLPVAVFANAISESKKETTNVVNNKNTILPMIKDVQVDLENPQIDLTKYLENIPKQPDTKQNHAKTI